MASASAADAVTAESSRTETSPPWRWRGVGPALAIVAIGGGLALRLVAPSPLWLDEALSVNIARLAPADMVDALRHDGHPALYYLLLGWWMDLFGESDFAVRALSAVFSLLTVPVLWAITRRHGARLAGATVLVALTSPYLVRFGTEARMYALLALLVALGWLAIDRALERPTGVRLVAVAVVSAALVHTHYWSFWVIGAALGILAWTGWVAGRVEPGLRRACRLVGASVAAGAASFAVWLGVFLDQLGSTGTPWADRARPAEIAVETI
ncbi:MAG: hypothetical protein GWN79_18165, partial [Actinobacteria bacterium]|nr:hypothetical protein [Actinomycetota bacterium]NIS34017.1 hypothetical protein [Actinomycetota bacterium]NIU20879.1 hypothetical protein [Actinomycetota bacterium]NIU68824.1 hypothetical protein [Actinomycetota bacterium]NIV88908.1 hypothetical protein [Actinomycetota bacterium]